MPQRSFMRGRFPISLKEAKTLFKQLRRAWRYEELVPQPEGYILIPLKRIKSPDKPARRDLGDLGRLKESIRRTGLLQPITVTPADKEWKEFEPVIGLRRYHACLELGLDRVPCCIDAHVDKEKFATLALEENRHRKDLTNREILDLVKFLRSKRFTIEKLAEIVGTDKGTILTYLEIPKLPEAVRKAFTDGELSLAYLVAMRGLGRDEMVEMLKRIEKEGLTIDAVRELVSLRRGTSDLPEFIRSRARGLLGKNIVFTKGRKGIKLTIRASSEAELRKILRRISG